MSNALDHVLTTLDAQINANGETKMETAPVLESESAAAKKDPDFIHMPLTPELLSAARAKAGTAALGPWLQQWLAAQLGVTLPVKTDGRNRYGTDETARENAKIAARDKVKNLRKGLLMKHRAEQDNDAAKLAEALKIIAANG